MPDPIEVSVGERIRARRRALHVSQTALGEALGVSFQQIQKYERGVNRISASMLTRAAETLDCTARALMDESPTGDLSPVAYEMAAFDRLTPDAARAVLALVASMRADRP